jgi:Flp pilus assembly secretin CpaC
MRYLAICAILGASFSTAIAEEPPPPAAVAPDRAAEAAEHLQSAAQHLEEAGLPEQAARLRDQAAGLLAEANDALLQRKLDEAASLRAEIADLRRLTGRPGQFVLRVTVLEVDRDRLRERGVEWTDFPGTAPRHGPATAYALDPDDAAAVFGFVDWLRKNELVSVLAEPTLTTQNGQPACFNVGGEFPILAPQPNGSVSIDYKQYGTRLDFVPTELGGGDLRLQIRLRVSNLDPSRSVRIGDLSVPGLNVRELETSAELAHGQILVIGGPARRQVVEEVEADDDDGEDPFTEPAEPRTSERTVELIVIAQPYFVETAPGEARAKPARAAPGRRPALNAVDAPRTLPPR